jgi:hypothetical protein
MKATTRWNIFAGAAIAVTSVAVTLAAPAQRPAAGGGRGGATAPAPWPDAQTLTSRRLAAEGRPLFATDTPLEFTLTADFKTVNKDRNPNSTKTFPATITVKSDAGAETSIPVQIRTRGHVRRLQQTCSFAPLRIEFPADKVAGTVFEGHKNLKLGTHCRDADLYEQYVPREYAAYRIFNLMTPRSFRARLASASYVDAATSKPLGNRRALFIEDDDDVARRMEGRIENRPKVTFRMVDSETVTLMTLFEFMIGNTDASMYANHNIVLVDTPGRITYPVPYDFDYSGLVNARYAVPSSLLNLTSVRERAYVGPCRTAAEFEPIFERMRAVKAAVMKLFDDIPGLDAGYRKDAQGYVEKFYDIIGKPGDVKKAFVDGCNGRPGM